MKICVGVFFPPLFFPRDSIPRNMKLLLQHEDKMALVDVRVKTNKQTNTRQPQYISRTLCVYYNKRQHWHNLKTLQ